VSVIADPVLWRPYPRAHGSRGEPSTFSPTRALSPLYSLSPHRPICSPAPPPTAAPRRRPCQPFTPSLPPHQLEPICNSKRRLPRQDYRDHWPPLLPHRAHCRPPSPIVLWSSQGYRRHRVGPQFTREPTFFTGDLLFEPLPSPSPLLSSSALPHRYGQHPTIQPPQSVPRGPVASWATPCLVPHRWLAEFGR
jgi:hypothetical protein